MGGAPRAVAHTRQATSGPRRCWLAGFDLDFQCADGCGSRVWAPTRRWPDPQLGTGCHAVVLPAYSALGAADASDGMGLLAVSDT